MLIILQKVSELFAVSVEWQYKELLKDLCIAYESFRDCLSAYICKMNFATIVPLDVIQF